VDDGREYLSALEERLNRERPEVRWEVLNTAVPGYNSVMEVATLREKALRYGPDLVILGFCINDMGLPNFIRDAEDYLALGRSFLLEFVTGRVRAREAGGGGLAPRPTKQPWQAFEEENPRVPARYAHMVGLDAFRRAMGQLRELGKAGGFEVLVLFYPGAPPPVREAAAGWGFHVLDAAPLVRGFLREHAVRDYRRSPLALSRRDPHPSVLAHGLIAGWLFESMRDEGLLDRLAGPRS
jgi:hypothetical protein